MSDRGTMENDRNPWRYRDAAWLLIGIAFTMQLARVLGISAVHGELPFLSANDRSRWCAIAALTEDGKWEIDRIVDLLDSRGKSKIWSSIDIVRHQGADGKEHFYSSKPPLLTAMLALCCKPVTYLFGKKLTEEPFLIGRTMLILVNVIPLALWWIWFHRWLEQNVASDWSRFMLLNMALWGTFLSTFAVTLNNHLHGALCFTMSLAFVWQITTAFQAKRDCPWWLWIACGLSAGLTVACELPALAWAAAAGVILLAVDWRKFFIGYGLGTATVAIAFLGTNIWAHQDWRPPYSHRGVGAEIGTIPKNGAEESPNVSALIELVNKDKERYALTDKAVIIPARLTGVLQLIDESVGQRVAVVGNGEQWSIHHWDDWYDFPKSYWLPGNKKGVDRGEPNRWWYLLNFTIGHHGIFSITPFWILSVIGVAYWVRNPKNRTHDLKGFLTSEAGLAVVLCAVSVACLVFYASRDIEDRNYAGVCSGFRWVFWLTPAWLWLSVPVLTAAADRPWARKWVVMLVMVSILSATIPWPNPWTSPWPYRIGVWLYPEPPGSK